MLRTTVLLSMVAGSLCGPIVDIEGLGKVEGVVNGTVNMFLGIRYADQERWGRPRKTAPWSGVYNATEWGNACYGAAHGCRSKPYSEDCLYLNVYTPVKPSSGSLPVLLWIHGGSYVTGCGSYYPGEALAARGQGDVIVVTINYRLGVFGFLGGERLRSAENPSTGNYGFQDQQEAMRWVKQHIKAFGGNGDAITIFGESAGAGSVACHLASKHSEGLYQKAVAESGLGASWDSNPMYHAEEVFLWLLGNTSCKDVACLKNLTAEGVIDGTKNFPAAELGVGGNLQHLLWAPVVDGVELTQSPGDAFAAGNYNKQVDVMAGTNRDEVAMFLDGVHFIDEPMFELVMIPLLHDKLHLMDEVKQLYSNASFPYPKDLGTGYTWWWWATMAAATDSIFTCPHRRATRHISSTNPLWSYVLLHPTSSPTAVPDSGPNAFLVPHASDIPYVYNCTVSDTPYDCAWTVPAEQELAEAVSQMWINFAKNGNPGAPWSPYQPASDLRLGIDVSAQNGGKGLHQVTSFHSAQCDFWDRIQA